MNFRSLSAVAATALLLSACASAPLPPPQATLDNIQAIRGADLVPLRVGDFVAGPGRPSQMDRKITVRAGAQVPPSGSYAKMLGETLAAQLKAGGRLDPSSSLEVSGILTDTHLDSDMSHPAARLAAHFTLKRAGAIVFEKTLSAESTWKGSFIGAVAIPDAFNHYDGLFPALVNKLLTDPDFQAAAKVGG